MSDFTQGSQWDNFSTGEGYYGDTTMDDEQIQDAPAGDYADFSGMQEQVPVTFPGDVFSNQPGKFHTQSSKLTRVVTSLMYLFPSIVDTGQGFIAGFSVRETAGAAGSFAIYDGLDSNSRTLLSQNVAANGSSVMWFGEEGILYRYGCYLKITGALEVCVFRSEEIAL